MRKSTDAQLRAVKRYQEKHDELKLHLPKGKKEEFREAASIAGKSLNAFMMEAADLRVQDYRVINDILNILSEEMIKGMARGHGEFGDEGAYVVSDIMTDVTARVFNLFDKEYT